MDTDQRTPLTQNHRHGIANTLALLDEMLCRFEGWPQDQPAEGLLFRQVNMLSAERCEAIEAEILAMRRMLAELRDDLRLGVKT